MSRYSTRSSAKIETEKPKLEGLESEESESDSSIHVGDQEISTRYLPVGPVKSELKQILDGFAEAKRPQRKRMKPTPNVKERLLTAVTDGNVTELISVMMVGAQLDQPLELDTHNSAIHIAAQNSHFLCVYVLLQMGVSPNQENIHTETPLFHAVDAGDLSIIQLLIESGATIDYRGPDDMTPLHIAVRKQDIEAVKMLTHFLLKEKGRLTVDARDYGGWTPLMFAIETDQHEIAEHLLNRGASPHACDLEGNSALHWGAISGNVEMAMLLDNFCAHSDVNLRNLHGDTPTHLASRAGHVNFVKYLLMKGADVRVRNEAGETPLDVASDLETQLALKVRKEFADACPQLLERVVLADVSRGRENFRIPVVNSVDSEGPPIDFKYVPKNLFTPNVPLNSFVPDLEHCKCTDLCTSQSCTCADYSERNWYDEKGRLIPEVNFANPPVIFECNVACACWTHCRNRVVQNGINVRLELFKTKGKGWGVRTLQDLVKGSFIAEYAGEILPEKEAESREDDHYVFDLDSVIYSMHTNSKDNFSIDGKNFGNVARFLNHSCDPNLSPLKVFIDHQDIRFPRIAFFAMRDIKKYEELCFDYGDKFWSVKCDSFMCHCGSDKCKYNTKDKIEDFLLEFAKTLPNRKL